MKTKRKSKKLTLEQMVEVAHEAGLNLEVGLRPRITIALSQNVYGVLCAMALRRVRGNDVGTIIEAILESWIWANQEHLLRAGVKPFPAPPPPSTPQQPGQS